MMRMTPLMMRESYLPPFGLLAVCCPAPVNCFNREHNAGDRMKRGRRERREAVEAGGRSQRTQTGCSLTSWQLVILETSWAPWQHRMNPARLRSTHTTDSRTNTLTWRWRGRGTGGQMDYCDEPNGHIIQTCDQR